MTLSEKMKKIVKELNMTQDTFIKNIQEQNREQGTKMSESSLKKIFSGTYNKDNRPTILTIDKIITYLKSLNNPKFNNISYDYLLNDDNINLSNENININKITKLTDETIENIKKISNDNGNIILNDFINNIDSEFWSKLKLVQAIKIYKDICNKIKRLLEDNFFVLFEKDLKNMKEICSTLDIDYDLTDFPVFYYDDLIKNQNNLLKLKKIYKFHDFSVVNHYIFLLKEKSYLEKIIKEEKEEKNSIELTELNFSYFESFFKNKILVPLELWKEIKQYANKEVEVNKDKIIKYEISEYLTLYMNK